MKFSAGPERNRLALRERREIARQSGVYGMSVSDGTEDIFAYRRRRLDSSYKSVILDQFATELKKVNPSPTVLDIASGLGEASTYLETQCDIPLAIRLDVNHEALKGQSRAVEATAWQLSFLNNDSITGIHFKDGITHIAPEFRGRMFSEFARVLEPGGLALVVGATHYMEDDFQYPSSAKAVLGYAETAGLTSDMFKHWRPISARGDWYTSPRKQRFVLGFRKPEHNINIKTPSDIVDS